jgi:hypothetical protein
MIWIILFVVLFCVALLETEPRWKKTYSMPADFMISLTRGEEPTPEMLTVKILKNRYSGSHPGFTYSFDYGYFDFEKYNEAFDFECPFCEAEK